MNRPTALPLAALLLGTALLAGCASNDPPAFQTHALTPLDHYPMQAQSREEALHFKVHPKGGLSDNQRRALDQVAQKASWNGGVAMDIIIVTAAAPDALYAGETIRSYLMDHQVSANVISRTTAQTQPADVVSLVTHEFRAEVPLCNVSWENLAATRHNAAPQNMGCSINANLAAQIDDPRDIAAPQAAVAGDAGRRTLILEKYRKGEVTSAIKDDAAKSDIAQVLQ